jgi:hypothetical protein
MLEPSHCRRGSRVQIKKDDFYLGDRELRVQVPAQHVRRAVLLLLPHVQPEALATRQIYLRYNTLSLDIL